jgi:hypothetical protein
MQATCGSTIMTAQECLAFRAIGASASDIFCHFRLPKVTPDVLAELAHLLFSRNKRCAGRNDPCFQQRSLKPSYNVLYQL